MSDSYGFAFQVGSFVQLKFPPGLMPRAREEEPAPRNILCFQILERVLLQCSSGVRRHYLCSPRSWGAGRHIFGGDIEIGFGPDAKTFRFDEVELMSVPE